MLLPQTLQIYYAQSASILQQKKSNRKIKKKIGGKKWVRNKLHVRATERMRNPFLCVSFKRHKGSREEKKFAI